MISAEGWASRLVYKRITSCYRALFALLKCVLLESESTVFTNSLS